MSDLVFGALDRLLQAGAITGYTYEPQPRYLTASMPTLTYSMYTDGDANRRNLLAFMRDMTGLGAVLSIEPTHGNVAVAGSAARSRAIKRSRQSRVQARFPHESALRQALALVQGRYTATRRNAAAGSWRYPDVRIAGLRTYASGTVPAIAHTLPVDGGAVVVLSLSNQPPLRGMQSHPVHLLDRWHGYLAQASAH